MSDTVRVNMGTHENEHEFRLCDLYEDTFMERGLDYYDMPKEMFDRYNRVMAEYDQLMLDMKKLSDQQTNEHYSPKKNSWLKA